MIRLAAILMLLATLASGQTTHERYILVQDSPGPSTSNVWVLAWSDRTNAPHWWHWANERGLTNASLTALPCLVDTETWQAIQRTGTIEQAEADLTETDRQARPAKKALRQFLGKKPTVKAIRQAQRQARKTTLAAQPFAAFRVAYSNELTLLELIEDYEDEKESP